ncbi:MAG: oligosaccharide flippase family protein [Flavipsychrobacter sp.]|nr:oligosaccharide flippase family protein [Flavipsychrobacter sp.]
MGVAKQVGKGFVSYLWRNVLEKIMGLIAMVFLARELTPYDFGLVSITEVLLYLISVFGTTGLAEFLLAYRKDDTDEIFKAAFWFNIIITAVIGILFLCCVPLWSVWQHDERIINIGGLIVGVFIFSQLQTIPKTWLSKNLQFDKQVKVQAPFIVLIPLAKIAAVFAGWGVYSLIIPTLVFQPILTYLLYKSTSISLSFQLYTNRWKEIYHFTKHLIGATIFTRITDYGDKLILARFVGIDKLGIYNIAFQLAELFTGQLTQVSNNVLSSVLPKYVDDKEKFYRHYISFLKAFSFIILPVLAIMFIAAKPIILLLYGPKWIEAVLPLQILTISAAFKALSSSYGCVMNSFHQNKKSFFVTAVYGPVHLAASAFGAMFGLAGLAIAVTVVKIVFINWNIKQVMDVVTKPFVRWYEDVAPFLIINILSGAVIYFIASLLPKIQPLALTICIAIGFIILYIVSLRLVLKQSLSAVAVTIHNTFPKLSPYFNKLFCI